MKILVTGGLGFIGSNFVRYLVDRGEDDVVIFDALTYAGRLDNIRGIEDKVEVLIKDIRDFHAISSAAKDADMVYHFAAESHVDRSIADPRPFMETDFIGAYNVLEAVRQEEVDKLIYISTSEVYGTALREPMDEDHPINPQSPYAAPKAGADRMCYAYYCTYGLPVIILRPFNNYGPRQFPEKLIPHFITRAYYDKPLPVYGDGLYSRDWLYVKDNCEAIYKAQESNAYGEAINLGTGEDTNVITIARLILRYMNKPEELIIHVEDRPGHVRRHISSTEKAEKLLGWRARTKFTEGLRKTVDWYLANKWWWEPLI